MLKIPAQIVGVLLFVAAAAFGQMATVAPTGPLAFGTEPVNLTTAAQTLTVTADTSTTLDQITASQLTVPAGFTVSIGTCSSGAGNSCVLSVAFAPTTATVGPVSGNLVITATTSLMPVTVTPSSVALTGFGYEPSVTSATVGDQTVVTLSNTPSTGSSTALTFNVTLPTPSSSQVGFQIVASTCPGGVGATSITLTSGFCQINVQVGPAALAAGQTESGTLTVAATDSTGTISVPIANTPGTASIAMVEAGTGGPVETGLEQVVLLTAAPTSVTMPDATLVPMWGYNCGTAVTTSGATCAKLNPAATGWSPVVITVPSGQDLEIELTNNLSFPVGSTTPTATLPTSLVIVGQLGGGLGTPGGFTPFVDHTNAQANVTWPIVNTGTGMPPVQGPRVRSFSTEVAAGMTTDLIWKNLRPGTYLLESGTHPSIQGPMGLYGIVVVTTAPTTGTTPTAGTAYPGVTYNAEVPLLLSEIDPVQNKAVDAAVNTSGFSESMVWSGLPGGCGNPSSSTYQQCYPPAVNYTPLYYMINGVAFNKTSAGTSLFAATPGTASSPITGSVLVRLVNAGLRMHVPSIVGSLAAPSGAPGFSLIAEDGNPLPGVPRVQSEVFMAAGKTYDVMINAPAGGTALPIFDRELSLSGNAIARDAGMLAYIGVNGAGLPVASGSGPFAAVANPDTYNSVIAGKTLTVSDPAKGVLANDVNVYGVKVVGTPAGGTVTLNANGTFTFAATAASGSFQYCGNGTTSGAACATVTLGAAPIEGASGIVMNPVTYTSNVATHLSIAPPGVLSVDKDLAGYPLTVVTSGTNAPVPSAGLTLSVDPNGGFNASVTAASTGMCPPGTPLTSSCYTFAYYAQNSQGTVSGSTATATLVFPQPSNLQVTVLDGRDKSPIGDYRWILEEDRTFYIDPNCTTNPLPANCPTMTGGIVPTFGTNFHTSYMPVVAAGCTGTLSCEGGQTLLGVPAVCDVGNGVCRTTATQQGMLDPSQVHLDPAKRYYISVLPGDAANPFEIANLTANCVNGATNATDPGITGVTPPFSATCGHGMGGAPVPAACPLSSTTTCPATPVFAPVTVLTQPTPLPPAQLSVFVFQDDFPLNGEHDAGGGIDVLAPQEPGLGGFQITLFDDAGGTGDATGTPTYDMFNQPLTNSLAGTIDPTTGFDACPISAVSRIGMVDDPNFPPNSGHLIPDVTQKGITGMIVTCPKYESDNKTLSPLAGQAVITNMYPGRYGVMATPAADRIARGEEWLQTNTLDGQKAHDSFLRVGGPGYFQEFGPASYHVTIGFANPAIINARKQYICNGTDPNFSGANCTNSVTGTVTTERMSRTPDERLYSSGDNSSYSFTQCYVSLGDADGEDFAFTKCDANGNFTLSGIPDGDWRITVFDQWNDMLVDGLSTPVRLAGGTTTNIGQIATNQWQANIYTKTFFDQNGNGIQDVDAQGNPTEPGLTLVATNIRFRDGSYSNFNNTDLSGNAGFNEIFPLFSWYVVETDSTRYKNTGIHVVYDAGGPADGGPITPTTTCSATTNPPCGASTIAGNLANTAEQVPLPTALRVPGARYCASADCPPGDTAGGSTGRIDPAWVTSEGWQGFSGQNSFLEFGKKPFAAGETGGIHGEVIYASTRPFDDPSLLIHTSWTPDVPGVTINLYQEGTAPDGSQSLTLVDTTKTSSFDDWAQGFYPGTNKPYMNCPGQFTNTGANGGDLFYFTLFNQPMYLNWYNSLHGGPAPTALPNNAQFKCYDGMHNWNQLQPAPYDGMYQFPSITGINSSTGAPTGTNCTICVYNPDSKDPYRYGNGRAGSWTPQGTDTGSSHGAPMLPPGKYVVEVVVPPGYELVKEEDKNILIGDNYIAPVTVQFPGLAGSVYILPDQAEVASAYNANNPQNSTNAFGRTTFPSHEGDTGSVEQFWPCVGALRTVPDYISLFPQSHEVSPFAGATRNLCDRKEVTLTEQAAALAKFWIFSSTHVAAHYTGVITDDFTSEFDPFSPQFGEKFAPPNLPIAIKDWTGAEISRTYTDQWGAYNGLTYSTWEVNPPNPTGYGPTMMVTCMNDPGTGTAPDTLFNPSYSQFCYEIPFMPGQTQYMDTPVTPTSAFAGAGYNNVDCAYPDATPAISEVDGDGVGPWLSATGPLTLTITALGDQMVPNYAYSGPAATALPYNQKTIKRHYGFGPAPMGGCSGNGDCLNVTVGGVALHNVTWTDTRITGTINPNNVPVCAVQQQVQYGGPSGTPASPFAKCGQLTITAVNGKQSIDTVTVIIGGKAPTHVAASGSIQAAIDAAAPGDLIMVDPTSSAGCITASGTPTACSTAGAIVSFNPSTHSELLLMWKPVRLQGVGAASSTINANTHPAGKLDSWRAEVNCLFGLSLNGTFTTGTTGTNPFDPTGVATCGSTNGTAWTGFHAYDGTNAQVDPLPAEGIVGWDATLNGNLAQLLQEPSLMGALEGAGITVLAKGVNFSMGGLVGQVEGTFPAGTTLLTGPVNANGSYPMGGGTGDTNNLCHTTDTNGNVTGDTNPFPSNYMCNPSSIDGVGIRNSSQGGGGIFVHAWAHNLQIANNRIYNNSGTLSGGINLGQGEFAPQQIQGGTVLDPGSCVNDSRIPLNTQLPYCANLNVNIHHNNISLNTSTGDELFSATPAGAGGVSFCSGSDYYKFNYNWVCGNMSTGDGGGLAHLGFSYNGDIEHNSILFNQSLNPTIPANGGGLVVMGTPDIVPPCSDPNDKDCLANPATILPSDGVGPNLVVNANLIQGNAAEAGSGGGIAFQNVNGADVLAFPNGPVPSSTSPGWHHVTVTNNIIVNNVAGWDGGAVSLLDALNLDFINNTVTNNNSTASAGVLFDTLGAPLASTGGANCRATPTTSCAQPAGLVSIQTSAVLAANLNLLPAPGTITCPPGHYAGTGTGVNGSCRRVSYPALANNVLWRNSSFHIGVGALGTGTQNQQHVVALFNGSTATQVTSQHGTGECVSGLSFWDIGVRGDTGPGNHSLGAAGTLNPQYSVLTSTTGYASTNSSSDPQAVSPYCNGSRVPPESCGNGGCGYNVPPGISDATVPNPIFNLVPVATVDEGNNWINMRWGPLTTTNPQTGVPLGDYRLASTSPALDFITAYTLCTPTVTTNCTPTKDFFGNPRPDETGGRIDVGAVEFQGNPGSFVAPTLFSIAPSSGLRGSTLGVTLTGTNLNGTSAVTVSGTGVTVTGVTVSATQVTATFAISTTAATTARNVTVTTPGGTSNPVTFTVNGATLTSIAPTSGLRGTTVLVTLTGTNFPTTGTTTVAMSGTGVTCTGVTVPNSTTVNASCAITTSAALTARTITLTTPAGVATVVGTVTFTVLGPTVTATCSGSPTCVSPATGVRGVSNIPLTITGTGLTGATGVTISGTNVSCTIFGTPTATTVNATCNVAAGAALGARTVAVVTPIGTTPTFAAGFTVTGATLTISAPSPTLAPTGTGNPNTTQKNGVITVSNGTGTNAGAFTFSTNPTLTPVGTQSGTFSIQPGGTCVSGAVVNPGSNCTINVRYQPTTTTTSTANVTVTGTGLATASQTSANFSGN
jgi:hypothetical protein